MVLKRLKRLTIFLIAFTLLVPLFEGLIPKSTYAADSVGSLGKGWRFRIDAPLSGAGKYHAHIYKGNRSYGSENVDGTESHKKNGTWDKNGVPKWVQDDVRHSREYKNAQEKQEGLNNIKRQMRSRHRTKGLIHSYANALMALGIFATVAYLIVYASLGSALVFASNDQINTTDLA